ncbi:MAG: VOC family protein [Marmoricola sp.]
MAVLALHHVQVGASAGGEDDQRRFYAEGLGLAQVEKPEPLRGRGGCWFRGGVVEVHVGIEPDFRPAAKAHPAFVVDQLDRVLERLRELGFPIDLTEEHTFPGFRRAHVCDGAGNRVELLEP